MRFPLLPVIISFIQLNNLSAQDTIYKSNPYLFKDGLFIESKDAFLPWKIDVNNMSRTLPSAHFKKSIKRKKNCITIDSISILWSAVLSRLSANVTKADDSTHYRVYKIIGLTDFTGYDRLYKLFKTYTDNNGTFAKHRSSFSTSWPVNGSWVQVGYKKNKGYYFYLEPGKIRRGNSEGCQTQSFYVSALVDAYCDGSTLNSSLNTG